MKIVKNVRRKNSRGSAPIREEWDFKNCPTGWKYHCWQVEFQREEFRLLREQGEKFPAHFIGKPHLMRSSTKGLHAMTEQDWDNLYGIGAPPDTTKGIWALGLDEAVRLSTALSPSKTRDFVGLKLNWDYPDKLLLKGFSYWLKKFRKRPANETRGNLIERSAGANLKALGAYRLLKFFTAEQAREHTEKILGHGLYAKIPDWYEARSKIKALLKSKLPK